MFNKILNFLKNFDWILFFPVLLLVSFGLVELYSIALGQGNLTDGTNLLNFNKQLIFAIVGFILLFLFAFFDSHNLLNYSKYLYIVSLILLLAVLLFGDTVRGTKGWFNIFGFGVQPVEIIKVFLILFLAKYFSDYSAKIEPLKHLLISGGATILLVILVIAQPDFGSAVLLILTWIAMIIFAGFDKKYLFYILFILLLVFSSAWLFYFKDYQKNRLLTFLNPSSNPLEQSYNVAQAIIAVGSGGLNGRGVGFGSQSQLKFLPESQNDFIFAVIAEELGFIGVTLLLFFFTVFIYRGLTKLKKIKNDFGIYFILGCLTLIFIEMFINIGMNMGILPVVGLSLPFVSYGGSSLISSLILVGLMESIIIKSKT